MAKVTVSIPQGTRDFSAEVVRKRQYILNTIKTVFELYGFQPLETPAMENLETLMGKYGEEGDKLIFKILNNGINEEKNKAKTIAAFDHAIQGKNDKDLTARALKYDLTIPFARYVAMNHGTLTFPFKRYQIQPVWRADRPQRGRYREFMQCDADVVGSKSLMNEVELVCIYAEVFKRLGITVDIKINSRKILAALAMKCGGIEHLTNITVAIDKLDKIGLDKVVEELQTKELNATSIETIKNYLALNNLNNNIEKLNAVTVLLGDVANEGVNELDFVTKYPLPTSHSPLTIDFTLARGLNYYTGCIFEIKALDATMGSIGGGGRYDDLTGTFGVPDIPGVGISFGVDRIYDVMEELNLFPTQLHEGTKVLFFNLGEAEAAKSFELMQQLRAANISCELYHDNSKMDKQFKYAEKKNIPFVVTIGTNELEKQSCTVKNITTGEKEEIAFEDLVNYVWK
jgi:histidyl-tRNA synthetase